MQVRRDMHELFRLCCFVALGCFSQRVGTAANPNGFDTSPPLPPPVDILNQALAVPAAAAAPAGAAASAPAAGISAAPAAAVADEEGGGSREGVSPAAATPGFLLETGGNSNSSSCCSRTENALLLQELQRRLALLQPPSLAAPCCTTEANKAVASRASNSAVSCPTTAPADVAAVFGLAALLMQCADVRRPQTKNTNACDHMQHSGP